MLRPKNLTKKSRWPSLTRLSKVLGNDYEYRRVELVGPQVGDELKKPASSHPLLPYWPSALTYGSVLNGSLPLAQ
ncbi:MAG: hypothetical protein ACLU99_02445 [Alphaproteobacteria bacterium]